MADGGDQTKVFQKSIEIPQDKSFKTAVEEVIFKQQNMIPTRNAWEVLGQSQHKRLSEVAIRLSVLAVQSANVERVCKARSVIHTKARNRLKIKSVNMLLFCYVNLRLLKKDNTSVGEFLEDAILEEEIELSEEVNDTDEVEDIEEMAVEDADVSGAEALVVEDKNHRSWLESDESDEDED